VIEVVRGVDGIPDLAAIASNPRTRDVWTKADRKLLDRVARMLGEHGVSFALKCANQTCPDRQLKTASDSSAPGGVVLRCGCTDRHFQVAF